MTVLLWICLIAPFVGAFILALAGNRLSKTAVGISACVVVAISFVAAITAAIEFIARGAEHEIETVIYEWLDVGGLHVPLTLHLDTLSLIMMLIVTFVGLLIHLYAAQSMYDEDGYSRFFCYMNLFIGSMLVLVLANNLVFLYLGWEGVGLCSYLLIGFWYKDAANGRAAQKAFIMTRVGDVALFVGLLLLYLHFGTLNIDSITILAPKMLVFGSTTAVTIAFLILGGAIGKSAQVPLQTWLIDAMAGPTPVSALIHAATMVTAGVYLIARLNALFTIAPVAGFAVAVVGTFTLFYSGLCALVQRDIKRVLAYSTISQIGYMFLALGVGAWSAAIFHFVTHAFFKSLLFLSAGVVIDAQNGEHDLFKMGGLWRSLPTACWTFMIGAAALAAIPIVTSGFYSKDAIILAAYSSRLGYTCFWLAGLVGTFVTAIYAFRAWLLAFFGEQKIEITRQPGRLMKLSLIVLAFFSLTAGFLNWPMKTVSLEPFNHFIAHTLPLTPTSFRHAGESAQTALLSISAFLALSGVYITLLYFRNNRWAEKAELIPGYQMIHRFLFIGWGFDWIYEKTFVKTYKAITYINRNDFVEWFFRGWAELARLGSMALSATQTGRVRNYAAALILGALVLTAIVTWR